MRNTRNRRNNKNFQLCKNDICLDKRIIEIKESEKQDEKKKNIIFFL